MSSRWKRLKRQSAQARISERMRSCCRQCAGGVVASLDRTTSAEGTKTGRVGGVLKCGGRLCAVCGEVVKARDAELFGSAAAEWAMSGGELALGTLTFRSTAEHCGPGADIHALIAAAYAARSEFSRTLTDVCRELTQIHSTPGRFAGSMIRASKKRRATVRRVELAERALERASTPKERTLAQAALEDAEAARWPELTPGQIWARWEGVEWSGDLDFSLEQQPIRWTMAEECTVSKHGLHIHFHFVLWVPPGVELGRVVDRRAERQGYRLEDWERMLWPAWRDAVTSHLGEWATPNRIRGVHLAPWRRDPAALGWYVAGFGASGDMEQLGAGKRSLKKTPTAQSAMERRLGKRGAAKVLEALGAELAGKGKKGRQIGELLDSTSASDHGLWARYVRAHVSRKIVSHSDRGAWKQVLEHIAVEWRGTHEWGRRNGRRSAISLAREERTRVGWISGWALRWLIDQERLDPWVEGETEIPGLLCAVAESDQAAREWWAEHAPQPLRGHALWAVDLDPSVRYWVDPFRDGEDDDDGPLVVAPTLEEALARGRPQLDAQEEITRVLSGRWRRSEVARLDPDGVRRMDRRGWPVLSAQAWYAPEDCTPDGVPRVESASELQRSRSCYWTAEEVAAWELRSQSGDVVQAGAQDADSRMRERWARWRVVRGMLRRSHPTDRERLGSEWVELGRALLEDNRELARDEARQRSRLLEVMRGISERAPTAASPALQHEVRRLEQGLTKRAFGAQYRKALRWFDRTETEPAPSVVEKRLTVDAQGFAFEFDGERLCADSVRGLWMWSKKCGGTLVFLVCEGGEVAAEKERARAVSLGAKCRVEAARSV